MQKLTFVFFLLLASTTLAVANNQNDWIALLKVSDAYNVKDIAYDGTLANPHAIPTPFKDVIVFACGNIPNARFMLNNDQTRICRIGSRADAEVIDRSVSGGPFFGDAALFFTVECPELVASSLDRCKTAGVDLRSF